MEYKGAVVNGYEIALGEGRGMFWRLGAGRWTKEAVRLKTEDC
jgi:hypothetical protein